MLDSANLGEYFPEVNLLSEQSMLMLHYDKGEKQYCVFFCFSDHPEVVNMPSGQGNWRLRLNSAASRWGGPGDPVPRSWTQDLL